MRKVIFVTDIPDDCYQILAEVKCNGTMVDQVHVLSYNEDGIGKLLRAYNELQKQLEDLGVDQRKFLLPLFIF